VLKDGIAIEPGAAFQHHKSEETFFFGADFSDSFGTISEDGKRLK
jgi:hypothetical protein